MAVLILSGNSAQALTICWKSWGRSSILWLEPIPKPLSTAIGCKARGSALSAQKVLDVPQHASGPFAPLALTTSSSLDLAIKQVLGRVLVFAGVFLEVCFVSRCYCLCLRDVVVGLPNRCTGSAAVLPLTAQRSFLLILSSSYLQTSLPATNLEPLLTVNQLGAATGRNPNSSLWRPNRLWIILTFLRILNEEGLKRSCSISS